MRKSKSWTLLLTTSGLVIGSATAIAGPQSALDPYASISGTNLGRSKPAVVRKTTNKAVDTYDGLTSRASGLGRSGQAIGAGLVSGSLDAGNKLAESGKRLGQKVANKSLDGAKVSGEFLIKGARVFGHGVRHTGEKLADGGQTVIENVSTWPKNIKQGLALTGDKLADGGKAVGHQVKAGSEKLKSATEVVVEKTAAAPRAVGQGIAGGANKLKPGRAAGDSKDAGAEKAVSKSGEVEQVAEKQETKAVETPEQDKGPSLISKTAALPRAAGHQALRTAGKVGEGTQIVGKKVVALPKYMGRSIGKLWGRETEAPRATASGPVEQVH